MSPCRSPWRRGASCTGRVSPNGRTEGRQLFWRCARAAAGRSETTGYRRGRGRSGAATDAFALPTQGRRESMMRLPATPELLAVARRVVWFRQPKETLADPILFLAHV